MGIFSRFKNSSPASAAKAYKLHVQANRLSDSGKEAEAEKLYAEAMELYAKAEMEGDMGVKIYTGYCVLLMREGHFKKANDILLKIYGDKSLNVDDKYHLRMDHAVCQWRMGDIDKAIEDLIACGSSAKIGLYYNVATAVYTDKARETGDYSEAEALSAEALDYDDEDYAVLGNAGWLWAYRGEMAKAKDLFGRSLEQNERFSPSLCGLAYVEHSQGNDISAREHMKKALSVHFPTTSPITRDWAEKFYTTLK